MTIFNSILLFFLFSFANFLFLFLHLFLVVILVKPFIIYIILIYLIYGMLGCYHLRNSLLQSQILLFNFTNSYPLTISQHLPSPYTILILIPHSNIIYSWIINRLPSNTPTLIFLPSSMIPIPHRSFF